MSTMRTLDLKETACKFFIQTPKRWYHYASASNIKLLLIKFLDFPSDMFPLTSIDMATFFPTILLKSGSWRDCWNNPLRLQTDVVNFVPFVLVPPTCNLQFVNKMNYSQDLMSLRKPSYSFKNLNRHIPSLQVYLDFEWIQFILCEF